MRRNLILAGFVAAFILVAPLALRADHPPRFTVTFLDALEGDNTQVYDLNDLGQTTGESGTGLISVGYHAFLGQPDGQIENVETLEGYDISAGQAINNSSQIAGDITYFPGQYGVSTIFRYTPGVGMVELGTLGGSAGVVVDINEAGDVTGYWDTSVSYQNHAFLYTDADGLLDLGTLGGNSSYARDVNNAGQVVGYAWTADARSHAFLWEDGEMHDLGTLGGDSSTAYYVSNTGVVVGDAQDGSGQWCAFRYTAQGGMEALPTLPGMTSCVATWVTDSGMVTGWWQDEDFHHHAFYYTDSEGMGDMGLDIGSVPWTGPLAANDAGEIILVTMDDMTYEVFPYFYSSGVGAYNINDLLTVELGWQLQQAVDINAAGQIIASGYGPLVPGGAWRYRSALLTPVEHGDMNCDGAINAYDIDGFIMAIGDVAAYEVQYPLCGAHFADINGDGYANSYDIDSFIALLGGG